MPATRKKIVPEVDALEAQAKAAQDVTNPIWEGVLESNPLEVQARMASRLQDAETLDDLFDALTGTTSDQLEGTRLSVESVAWQVYESDRGPIPLAVVQGINLDTGEELEFATTGFMLVHFIRRAQMIGAIPFRARIVGKRTRNNQTALNFERA